MNNTERALALLHYQPYDRLPVVHFGFWDETLEKWIAEGHLSKDHKSNAYWLSGETENAWREAERKLGFDFEWGRAVNLRCSLVPPFESAVVAEFPDGSKHIRDHDGVTLLQMPGAGSIPAEIDHLLKGRAEWEEHYKHRLQWAPERLPDKAKTDADWAKIDCPKGVFCGSMIGSLRNIVGVVGLAYLTIDDEELLDEMLAAFASVSLKNVQALFAAGWKFDYAHFWEDICFKNGPLVNPEFFAEKIAPHYKPITEEFRRHGVELVSVDCDGMIDDLIPAWLENGVNTMFPIEVGTWNASIAPWREKYGRALRGVGGMRKHVFSLDRAAIDEEIERLKPLVALGGFIPCPDHRIPPDAEWDLVRYYCDRMHATKW